MFVIWTSICFVVFKSRIYEGTQGCEVYILNVFGKNKILFAWIGGTEKGPNDRPWINNGNRIEQYCKRVMRWMSMRLARGNYLIN